MFLFSVLLSQIANVISKLSWAIGYNEGAFPYNAVSVGMTETDALFVCRAYKENNLLPGKLHPRHKKCFVPWDGGEVYEENGSYDVAVGSGRWVSSSGNIPVGAFRAGYEDGETLYSCRAEVDKIYQPGKFKPSHRACYVAYAFKEHKKRVFDVLVG